MALAGNVETIGLSSVFLFISTNSLSGQFRVKSDNGELSLYFDRGDIFFPKESRRSTYSLRGMLTQTRAIDRSLLDKHDGDEAGLEKALLSAGQATDAELEQARRMQFEEEIYDLFLWNRAFFEFEPGPPPARFVAAIEANQGFRFNTSGVLMEAARRADEVGRIRYIIKSLKGIYTVAPGQEEALDKALIAGGIESSRKAFDGRASVEAILKNWRVPYTQGLAVIATQVEKKTLVPLEREDAAKKLHDSIELGLVPQAYSLLSYLLDTEELGPKRSNLGVEGEVLSAKAVIDFKAEARFEANLPGPRVFQILKHALLIGSPFTIVLREDEHEKRITRTRNQLAISSTRRASTPKLIHYLERSNAVSREDSQRLWNATGKQLYDQLLGAGKVSKDQWLLALSEKVSEELVESFFWRHPQFEFINRPLVDNSARPMKIALPLESNVNEALLARLDEFAALIKVVPSEQAIFTRRHVDQQAPHPFFKRFDGVRPLSEVRRVARAGPIEFFRFVYNGVKNRILRAAALDEMVSGAEGALKSGNHLKALRYAHSIDAFDLEQHVSELLARVKRETHGLEITGEHLRLEGDLIHFSLAEVLQTLTQENLAGTLRLSSGKKLEMHLYFYRGTAYWIGVEKNEDEDFLELFSDAEDLGSDLAESFEMGLDSFADQARIAQLSSIKEKVLNVFFWPKARFEFTRNTLPESFWQTAEEGVTKIRLDTQSFLLEVLNKLRILDEIRRVIADEDLLVSFNSTEHKSKALAEGQFAEVVMIVDGRHSVGQLADACSGSRFDLYRFLYDLIKKGAAKVQRPPDFAKAWDSDREKS